MVSFPKSGYMYLWYFAWARSNVKVCYYFYILWHLAVFAQLPENGTRLGKYSTLGKNKCSVTIWPILLLNSVQIVDLA